jgi:hypothetical protein
MLHCNGTAMALQSLQPRVLDITAISSHMLHGMIIPNFMLLEPRAQQ